MNVQELLNCNWKNFCNNLMSFSKADLTKALAIEKKKPKLTRRDTFIDRLVVRITTLAKEEAIKKLKG